MARLDHSSISTCGSGSKPFKVAQNGSALQWRGRLGLGESCRGYVGFSDNS